MSTDPAVAIIGGGPGGLMAALLLARAGVRSVVFEKKPSISTHPKAMTSRIAFGTTSDRAYPMPP